MCYIIYKFSSHNASWVRIIIIIDPICLENIRKAPIPIFKTDREVRTILATTCLRN